MMKLFCFLSHLCDVSYCFHPKVEPVEDQGWMQWEKSEGHVAEEQSKLNLLQALTLTASQNGTSYRSLYIVSTRSKSNIEMEEKEWASCSSGPRNKPTLEFCFPHNRHTLSEIIFVCRRLMC